MTKKKLKWSDNDGFGYYISGLVDGEGGFYIVKEGYTINCIFAIHLRYDDIEILQQIKKFIGCGMKFYPHYNKGNQNPCIELRVKKIDDLYNIIIPFFEKYTLRAKKRLDFEIWKKAVELKYHNKYKFKRIENLLNSLLLQIREVRKFKEPEVKLNE